MAIDALRLARTLEGRGFSREQSEGLAEGLAEELRGQSETLTGLRTDVRVVQAILTIVVALLGAQLWFLVGMKGELAAIAVKLS